MNKDLYIREGRFKEKVGDIEFDYCTYDGIGIPPTSFGFAQRIKDICNLTCRSDDVLVASYPKSGTHWVSEILHMLLSGEASYMKYEMSSDLMVVPDLNIIENQVSPRFLSLHLPYKWFPQNHINSGGKIVHVTRNPKDTYVSYYHHNKVALPYGLKTDSMTWNQFFEHCLLKKNLLFGTWFDYEKEMTLAKKTNENIYTVHFELLKENPEKVIRRLSQFLGIPSTDTLVKDISVKCQFKNVKANERNKEVHPDVSRMIEHMNRKVPSIYRKGEVGDWKNHFTVAQNEAFEEMYEKEMDGIDVKVIY